MRISELTEAGVYTALFHHVGTGIIEQALIQAIGVAPFLRLWRCPLGEFVWYHVSEREHDRIEILDKVVWPSSACPPPPNED
ncbi:MAG: hypothetical protein JW809_15010 [Pirellulales bacterium]|nr:hypothetical protein [Pirellulales bacterium]